VIEIQSYMHVINVYSCDMSKSYCWLGCHC